MGTDRTVKILIGAVILITAAVSCVKEQVGKDASEEQKKFTAYVDAVDSKTCLGRDWGVYWSETDHITVFSDVGQGTEFIDVKVEEDGRKATFAGSIGLSDTYYAIYPAQWDAVYLGDDKVSANLPTVQTAKNGTFADGMNLSIAKTYDDNLHFKNAGALLAVKCPTSNAGSIKIVSRDPSVRMTGEAVISYNGGAPTVEPSGQAVEYVEAKTELTTLDHTYYFVVYPGNYSSGFDIIFTSRWDSDIRSKASSTTGLDLKRNDNVLLFDSPSGYSFGWNCPAPPTSLKADYVDDNKPGIRFQWSPSKSSTEYMKDYKVYVREAHVEGEAVLKGTTSVCSFFVEGLTPGRSYDFGVQTTGQEGKKDSETVWLRDVMYELPYDYPQPYPFESDRSGVPALADMTLCYGGNPTRVPQYWDKDRWRSHAVYTDKNGKDSWLFESFLALEFKTVCDGVEYVYDLANTQTLSAGKKQWIQQLDYWFDSTRGFQALDECIEAAVATAGPYPRKRYVVFSLPDPVYFQKFADKKSSTVYWGEIDGVQMDFSLIEHRQRAYIWMVDQIRARFVEKNYSHIELAGFYILQECLSESYNSQYKKFETVISKLAEYCKGCNEGLYWIPYGYSGDDEGHNGAIRNWECYGFTATILQPNKYWDSWRDWSTICTEYIFNEDLGMEFEMEGSHGEGGWSSSETPRKSSSILETVMTGYDAEGTPKGQQNPQAARNKARFREYMTSCKDYGIYGKRMLVLYSGTNAWHELASSDDELDKELYHEFSRFIMDSELRNK